MKAESFPISAFVVCFNEEKNIGRCLESIRWCDEIIVVDAGSTDKTCEIARGYNVTLVIHPWEGNRRQKEFALSLCSHKWVLNIDADEEVSSVLRERIISVISSDKKTSDSVKGYRLRRDVYFLGKWWKSSGWGPEYRLRLFQKQAASWSGTDPHEKAVVRGKIRKIDEPIYHYPYLNLSHALFKIDKATSVHARALYEMGVSSSIIKIVLSPAARFLKFFFLRKAFKEGKAGLIVSGLEAYSAFLKYTKLFEIVKKKGRSLSNT